MLYAPLFCQSNFSFLQAASHPQELIGAASHLGLSHIALTDECSLAGIVKAHIEAKNLGIQLIVGSFFKLSNGCQVIAIAPNNIAYAELSGYITLTRRRAPKGEYEAHFDDLRFRLKECLIIWLADPLLIKKQSKTAAQLAPVFSRAFKNRLWLGKNQEFHTAEPDLQKQWQKIGQSNNINFVATPKVLMHEQKRKPLLDTIWAIRQNVAIHKLGSQLPENAESYLKAWHQLNTIYTKGELRSSLEIARLCQFSLDSLGYQYPEEVVPKGQTATEYLSQQVMQGKARRWPKGAPEEIEEVIHKELKVIKEMQYEHYFLTVYDIVNYARSQDILCQGRGSAANSVVCYCLGITEISPENITALFERFISKERNEPPDIDVDFEHQRREEVIQYIYQKYTRERAALIATVTTYRARSAIRDVGKALGLGQPLIDYLAKSLAWWDRSRDLQQRIQQAGFDDKSQLMPLFYKLVHQLLGFPRHLSQHVGGFLITQRKISEVVPQENASMTERTVIQWDKDDIEAMGLMKVDVLALGMLTALQKALRHIREDYPPAVSHQPPLPTAVPLKPLGDLQDIPTDDLATYQMLCRGDSLGVFQVESRAQMSMLPRLKPEKFYDLVIQIAIVRPGPIQGDMVHPYLRRKNKQEKATYENDDLKKVLEPTLGVPIFQEQAIRLAMIAADFSGGEADQLRRAMASFGKDGKLYLFEEKFIQGMLKNGYSLDYANRLFNQIKGFGGYGFPESHSASFALLCYFSAWIKCHYPAAFYCALLNSQPMGFYSPSQLIQDAKRHNIEVLPVDINHSDYENTLEIVTQHNSNSQSSTALRLGLCRVKQFHQQSADKILTARRQGLFNSLKNLQQRTALSQTELEALAAGDAYNSLQASRQQALWHTSVKANSLKDSFFEKTELEEEQTLWLPGATEGQEMLNDYQSLGLSLRRHPMAQLREQAPFNRCKNHQALKNIYHGGFVRIAGIVTGRQRPGTAKGTIFLTLEDETGNTNIIIWKNIQEKFRQPLLNAKLLLVKGRLERQGSVTHVIAGYLEDCSQALPSLAISSRDFH